MSKLGLKERRRRLRNTLFLVFPLSMALPQPTAAAQLAAEEASEADDDESSGALEAARLHFHAGREAMQAEDWERASVELTLSHDAHPVAATAYSLAVVHENLGQLRRASELLSALLGGEYGELALDYRALVARHRARLQAQLPRVEVHNEAGAVELIIDGEAEGRIETGRTSTFVVDPGEHRFEAVHDTVRLLDERLNLSAEQVIALTVERPEVTVPDGGNGVHWAVPVSIVAGVLLIGGAIALGYYASLDKPRDLSGDPTRGRLDI